MISIIIPLYNAEKYIRRCVDNVLSQTLKSWEMILVNDGSTDNSLAICQEYANSDSRIQVIDKANGGVSSARNKGIEMAIGDYITFIDVDDVVEPSYLEELYKKNGYDLVVTGFFYNNNPQIPKLECMDLNFPESIAKNLSDYLSTDFFCFPWAKMFKSSIIKRENIRFDEKLRFGEDHVFNWTFLKYASFIITNPKPLYHKMTETESGVGYKDLSFHEIDYLDNRLYNIKKDLEKKYESILNIAPRQFFHVPFMKDYIVYQKLSFYVNYYRKYHEKSTEKEIYNHIANYLYHPALHEVRNGRTSIQALNLFLDKSLKLFIYSKIKSKITIPFIKMHLFSIAKILISKM